MTARLASILPVWVVAIVGAILVGTLAQPAGYFRWLSIVFALQLALSQKEGLVVRMTVSVGGSAILLAVATAILLPLST